MVNGKLYTEQSLSLEEQKEWKQADVSEKFNFMLNRINQQLVKEQAQRVGVAKEQLLKGLDIPKGQLEELPKHRQKILKRAKKNYLRILRQNANIQVFWKPRERLEYLDIDRPWLGNKDSAVHFLARFSATDKNFDQKIQLLKRFKSIFGSHIKMYWQGVVFDQASFKRTKSHYCNFQHGSFWQDAKKQIFAKDCNGIEAKLREDVVPQQEKKSYIRFPNGEKFSFEQPSELEDHLDRFLIMNSIYK